jgi:hypothetical protein
MRISRGNRSTRRKPAPVQLCPPQIPHDLTRARTRAAAVGSRQLTAWPLRGHLQPYRVVQRRYLHNVHKDTDRYTYRPCIHNNVSKIVLLIPDPEDRKQVDDDLLNVTIPQQQPQALDCSI